jgi:hypothetical protein
VYKIAAGFLLTLPEGRLENNEEALREFVRLTPLAVD